MAKTVFETSPCGRCGGSGHFSYNAVNGTTCFGCAGAGVQLTKRGKAAREFYLARLTIRADEIAIGDCVTIEGLVTKARVTAIETYAIAHRIVDGERVPMPGIFITTAKGNKFGCSAESAVRRLLPTEANNALIAEALAYQATLTKAGTVRKAGAREVEELDRVIE